MSTPATRRRNLKSFDKHAEAACRYARNTDMDEDEAVERFRGWCRFVGLRQRPAGTATEPPEGEG